MSYYRIDWNTLNALPPAEKMAALAAMVTSIQRVTVAERIRMAHAAIAEQGGGYGSQKPAAEALNVKPSRFNQLAKESPMTVSITPTAPAELYHHYQGQNEPQPCYVELDLRTRTLAADWNGEIGNAVPFSVHHGFERRYPIPALTSTAANALLEQIKPLAERMVSDWEEVWDGNNHIARLGDDALAAEEEIEKLCGEPGDGWDGVWEPSDCVTVWDTDSATNGSEASEYEITADTTDERLDEIEQQILEDLKGISDSDEVVLEGVDEYLAGLRDEAVEADQETLYWSVVRGNSPDADAVQPGPHNIDIPESVLTWAAGHGLSGTDSDVYLLVTTEDEAGDVQGEIAYTTVTAPGAEAAKVRRALAVEAADTE